jgi:hypothetical protein
VMFPLGLIAVAWTTIVLTVAELSPDGQSYSIVAGIILGLFVVGFFANVWRRSRDVPTRPDVADSRDSLGWAIIQAVGALIAAPFALYDWVRRQRGGFDGFWDATRRAEAERAAARAAAAAEKQQASQSSGEGR